MELLELTRMLASNRFVSAQTESTAHSFAMLSVGIRL